MLQPIKNFFVRVYNQLVNVNDSPQSIAIGFGMGVFLGILPATGMLAALALAFIFRFNKAAAVLGSALTNTWLSVVSFVISLQIGCKVLGIQWESIEAQTHDLMDHFSWKTLLDASLMNILKPLLIGYFIVGGVCGILAYALALYILEKRKKAAQSEKTPN